LVTEFDLVGSAKYAIRESAKQVTVVSVKLHKSGPSSFLVLFDGRKEPSRLHWTYVERIDHSAIGRD
jgi:hypothetical protein